MLRKCLMHRKVFITPIPYSAHQTLRNDFIVKNYFSILILASTATTSVIEPNNGFKSISAISGAA